MKRTQLLVTCLFTATHFVSAQTNPKADIFPQGTTLIGNVPYAKDTLKKHLLDIYIPPAKKDKYPVIVWIHGGAWMMNDKYADMGYMTQTLKAFADSGYAVVSIDYRWSTTAPFPAQLQDCNQAIEFLYENAAKYKLNKDKLALMGFSAGGHLANMVALTNNSNIKAFYANGKKPKFKIKLCLDFYGPSDFNALNDNDPKSPVSILLGATPVARPDLARTASPATYVDKNDPPFLIVQGGKDQSVNPEQSKNLHALLTRAGVKSGIIIVPNAPHYGVMFDVPDIRAKIFEYLRAYLK
ncbi:MAG TPA: alpha/beta hydrolase [Mucilaginibacter sp.]